MCTNLGLRSEAIEHVELSPETRFKPEKLGCYLNVYTKAALDGGGFLVGWTIWDSPENSTCIAEQHVVWTDGNSVVDITPRQDEEHLIWFLPDPRGEFEFLSVNNAPALGVFTNAQQSTKKVAFIGPQRQARVLDPETLERYTAAWSQLEVSQPNWLEL